MANVSLDATYFDRMYAANDDPWHFETSAYEREKYDATIAALGGRSFTSGFEIGCSIGVLTARLAQSCAALLSVDINERALDRARERCRELTNVRFERLIVPREFPEGPFDLIVVSEVAYYWSDEDLAAAIDRIAGAPTGTTVVLVHYLPKVADYPRDGDDVHAAFLADARFACEFSSRAERYRIDVLRVR